MDQVQVLNDFGDWLVNERNASDSTIAAYNCDVSQFFGYMTQAGIPDLRKVTPQTISDFFDQFGVITDKTKARKCSSLRTFFTFARSKRMVDGDPTEGARPTGLRTGEVAVPILSAEQVADILATAAEGSREHAVMSVLALGLTTSEAARLAVSDIDLTAGVLKVAGVRKRGVFRGDAVGSSSRTVTLTEEAARSLTIYLRTVYPTMRRWEHVKALFLNYAGRPLCRQSIWQTVTAAAKKAGVAAVNPQVLRITRAVNLLSQGLPVLLVQAQLGHADVSSTQRYAAMAKRRLEAAHAG